MTVKKSQAGNIQGQGSGGVNTGNATYSGNPKYVYDSSDVIRYKKLKAQGRTYNDKSFGGSIPQTQFTALARVRG